MNFDSSYAVGEWTSSWTKSPYTLTEFYGYFFGTFSCALSLLVKESTIPIWGFFFYLDLFQFFFSHPLRATLAKTNSIKKINFQNCNFTHKHLSSKQSCNRLSVLSSLFLSKGWRYAFTRYVYSLIWTERFRKPWNIITYTQLA